MIDCVIVSKDGYFDHTKVRDEDWPKYEKYVVGETANGYLKLQFPEEFMITQSNNVLSSVGIPRPEMLEFMEKMKKRKEDTMNRVLPLDLDEDAAES